MFCAKKVHLIHQDGLEIGCGQRNMYSCLYTLPSTIDQKDFVLHRYGVSAMFLGFGQKLPQLGGAHVLHHNVGGAHDHVQNFHTENSEEYIALQYPTTNCLQRTLPSPPYSPEHDAIAD